MGNDKNNNNSNNREHLWICRCVPITTIIVSHIVTQCSEAYGRHLCAHTIFEGICNEFDQLKLASPIWESNWDIGKWI